MRASTVNHERRTCRHDVMFCASLVRSMAQPYVSTERLIRKTRAKRRFFRLPRRGCSAHALDLLGDRDACRVIRPEQSFERQDVPVILGLVLKKYLMKCNENEIMPALYRQHSHTSNLHRADNLCALLIVKRLGIGVTSLTSMSLSIIIR